MMARIRSLRNSKKRPRRRDSKQREWQQVLGQIRWPTSIWTSIQTSSNSLLASFMMTTWTQCISRAMGTRWQKDKTFLTRISMTKTLSLTQTMRKKERRTTS